MTDVTPLHKKGKKDLKQNYRSADTNYADDDTPYVIADDINGIITSLEKASKALFDNKLTFEKHITDICRKASRKTRKRYQESFRTWHYLNDAWL